MNEKKLYQELESIIAYCDMVKDKAAGLRRKLDRFNGQASRKRAPVVAPEVIAHVLAKREKMRNRKRVVGTTNN